MRPSLNVGPVRDRWILLLFIGSYAILGGFSFEFFHATVADSLIGFTHASIWVSLLDVLYIACTALLVILLISRLFQLINDYEAALARSEMRFRSLTELTSDWVWEINERFEFTFVGTGVQQLLGYEPTELEGKTPFSLMAANKARQAAELLGDLAAKRQPFRDLELHFLHCDGYPVIVESSGMPMIDEEGVFRGFRGIDRNVTLRRQAEMALERSHDFYRSLFDEFPLPVWRSGTDGQIIYCNRAGLAYLGKETDEIGSRLGEIHASDVKAYTTAYKRAIREHKPFTLTYRLCRHDGEYRQVTHTGHPCCDPEGHLIGFIGYFREVE